MLSQWRSNLVVGTFVVSVLAVFLYFIMNYTNELGLFEARAYIKTTFYKPEGLFKGSSVLLNNVKIGRVTDIRFSSDLRDPKVHITMIVNESDLQRIGKDAVAQIETAGLLGDALINILPGNPAKVGHIKNGDYIEGKEKAGLLGGVDISSVVKKLDNILGKIEEGGIEAISSTIANASDITEKIKRGEGTLGKLIYDERMINEINSTLEELNKIVARINRGPGSVHSLIYKDDVSQMVADLRKVSQNLETVSKQISGMVGEIQDQEVAKKIGQLADNLARTSESLSQIAKSLEQGEGTVGALLQDPSLYEDLKIILGGAKRSEALRYVIQHSIRQKQKEAEKKKKSGAPTPQGEGGQ